MRMKKPKEHARVKPDILEHAVQRDAAKGAPQAMSARRTSFERALKRSKAAFFISRSQNHMKEKKPSAPVSSISSRLEHLRVVDALGGACEGVGW